MTLLRGQLLGWNVTTDRPVFAKVKPEFEAERLGLPFELTERGWQLASTLRGNFMVKDTGETRFLAAWRTIVKVVHVHEITTEVGTNEEGRPCVVAGVGRRLATGFARIA